MLEINKTVCDNGLSIYTSQITDNLSDLAPFFGANAETVINAAQRQFRSPRRLAERLTVEAMICAVMGKNARLSHTKSGRPYVEYDRPNVDCDRPNVDCGRPNVVCGRPNVDCGRPKDGCDKPSDKCNDVCISISHSRTHAALLVCNCHNCGVDIETLSPRILNVGSRIALPEEQSAVAESSSEENRILALTTLWTIKEAVYKSVENQEDFDILTDICVPAFHYDALVNNKLQKNTAKVVRKEQNSGLSENFIDVASVRLGNSILSYVAY